MGKGKPPELGGQSVTSARSQLHKSLLWRVLEGHGENICAFCRDLIEEDDFVITHMEPWKGSGDPSLFWDARNVVPAHSSCAMEHSYAQQRKKRADMKRVELEVIDVNGNVLPGAFHKGKLHVAGEPGTEYEIRLRNLTHHRVEVVVTVDGRDVMSGDPGSIKNRGYVLSPRQTMQIKGWRTSMSETAAFEFSSVEESYAALSGDATNVGVIGMAVWEEKRFRAPRRRGGPVLGSVRSAAVDEQLLTCSVTRGLGTGFGQAKESKVSDTRFIRNTETPVQKVAALYNTRENLEAMGVKLPVQGLDPFPADDRFCKAPPARTVEESLEEAVRQIQESMPTLPSLPKTSPRYCPPWWNERGYPEDLITCEMKSDSSVE